MVQMKRDTKESVKEKEVWEDHKSKISVIALEGGKRNRKNELELTPGGHWSNETVELLLGLDVLITGRLIIRLMRAMTLYF